MKNTVVVAFLGKKESGKDTAGNVFIENGFDRIAFADPLKQFIMRVYDLDEKHFYGSNDDKTAPIQRLGKSACQGPEAPVSGRMLMQYVGTEIFRALDPDVWARYINRYLLAVHKYNQRKTISGRVQRLLRRCKCVVVTDLRFPNEAHFLRSLRPHGVKVVIFYIDRDTKHKDQHSSETMVEQTRKYVDAIIPNHGTLDEFLVHVRMTFHTMQSLENEHA